MALAGFSTIHSIGQSAAQQGECCSLDGSYRLFRRTESDFDGGLLFADSVHSAGIGKLIVITGAICFLRGDSKGSGGFVAA